jgi:hypothetical protein
MRPRMLPKTLRAVISHTRLAVHRIVGANVLFRLTLSKRTPTGDLLGERLGSVVPPCKLWLYIAVSSFSAGGGCSPNHLVRDEPNPRFHLTKMQELLEGVR